MKPSELRQFVEELVVAHGASVRASTPHLLRFDSGQALAARTGRATLAFAFNQRGLDEDPTSELATVGNPVFDHVLELAQESGHVGVRYLPVPTNADRRNKPKPPDAGRGRSYGEAFDSYVPLYLHVFKVQSSVEEIPDTLETVAVDPVVGEALAQSPDVLDLWPSLQPVPEEGRRVPQALPVPEAVLALGLDGLERRLRRRVGRLKRDSDRHLHIQQESIGKYYQNLIEEVRSSKRRLAGGVQAKEEKIRLLQLDWKRRIEEAQEFWRPRVDVQLAGVGVVQRPSIEFPLQEGRKIVARVHYDLIEGRFLIPSLLRDGTLRG